MKGPLTKLQKNDKNVYIGIYISKLYDDDGGGG